MMLGYILWTLGLAAATGAFQSFGHSLYSIIKLFFIADSLTTQRKNISQSTVNFIRKFPGGDYCNNGIVWALGQLQEIEFLSAGMFIGVAAEDYLKTVKKVNEQPLKCEYFENELHVAIREKNYQKFNDVLNRPAHADPFIRNQQNLKTLILSENGIFSGVLTQGDTPLDYAVTQMIHGDHIFFPGLIAALKPLCNNDEEFQSIVTHALAKQGQYQKIAELFPRAAAPVILRAPVAPTVETIARAPASEPGFLRRFIMDNL